MSIKFRNKIPFSEDLWIHIISLFIDLIISLFASKNDPFGLMRFGITDINLYLVYVVLFYGLIILIGILHNRLLDYVKQKERKSIIKLSDLLTEGLAIRDIISLNYFKAVDKELAEPLQKYKEWFQKTLSLYKKIDPVRANQWMIYDQQSDKYQSQIYSQDCKVALNIIHGKMEKLNRDISWFAKQQEDKK